MTFFEAKYRGIKMRAVGRLMGALGLTLNAGATQAETTHAFYPVSIDLDTVEFIDNSSIKGVKPVLTLWTLRVSGPLKIGGEHHRLTNVRLNCDAQTLAIVYRASYDATGSTIDQNSVGTAPMPIPPNSVGESIMEIACGAKPRDTKNEFESVDAAVNFANFAMQKMNSSPKKN